METQSLDDALTQLQEHKQRWARLPLREKIHYLEEIRELTIEYCDEWVEVGAETQGLRPSTPHWWVPRNG